MEFAVRQAEINTYKEGLSKTLEQNQLNYEQEMEQIKRQKEDKLTKIQEWEKLYGNLRAKKVRLSQLPPNYQSRMSNNLKLLKMLLERNCLLAIRLQ